LLRPSSRRQDRRTGLSFGRTLLTGLPDQQQAGACVLKFRRRHGIGALLPVSQSSANGRYARLSRAPAEAQQEP
jgi:hypothetical protein